LAQVINELGEEREIFLNSLDEIGLDYFCPEGAYYVLADIGKFGAKTDTDFCLWLIEKIGVAAVPGSSFFKENINNYIRFHFAKKDETLIEAAKRLRKLKSASFPK
jgi:aminotransferase